MKKRNLTVLLIAVVLLVSVGSLFAQTPSEPPTKRQRTTGTPATPAQENDKKTQKPASTTPNGDRLEPDETVKKPGDVPQEIQANRHEQLSEEADVVPYYNNFFNTYRLGPEDVISVSVFNQDRYSRAGIVVPPSGRISLQLIPGGVFVNGKTVEEVEAIISKKYDEYIIDPQVTVSLEKAASYRYSILGDVATPGIRLMNDRMTVSEAITEAGGVLQTGDKSKVMLLRRTPNGQLGQIPINLSAIYKGKAPDSTYLVPGDQILVPGNKWKTFDKIMKVASVASFARIFTGGW